MVTIISKDTGKFVKKKHFIVLHFNSVCYQILI